MTEQDHVYNNNVPFEALTAPQEPVGPVVRTGGLREVVNFLKVSPFQQLFAAVNIACAASSAGLAAERAFAGQYDTVIGLAAVSLLNLAVFSFNEAVAAGKLAEYEKIKQALMRNGWDERIIEPKSHSWCQRNAARVAAGDSGYKQEVTKYYKKQGHKWYHFFPDFK